MNTELSVYFGILYFLLESLKGDDGFAEELSKMTTILILFSEATAEIVSRSVSLDPPLPVYLFTIVAGLRDKSFKGYPVKKVSSSKYA